MEAALVTGMFNFGISAANTLSKDVVKKSDSNFNDIFSKKIEKEKGISDKKENIKDIKNDVSEKKGIEDNKEIKDNKDVEDKKEVDADTDDKEKVGKTEEKDKETKKTEGKSKETEKVNEIVENIVLQIQNKEINLEDVENLGLTDEEMLQIQDLLNEGFLQNVVEVGPQNVETEKITSNEYEDLEKKLESLLEKLEGSGSDVKEIGIKLGESSEGTGMEDFTSSFDSQIEEKDTLKVKVGKNKDGKNNDFEFVKNEDMDVKFEQMDVGLGKMDVKIENVENIVNTVVNKATNMQEQLDVIKQISEHVDVNLFEDKSEMIIKLKPDHLGKVTVEIAVENGNITAKFLAESQKVKEILESNMQDLKDHLAKQGMTVQDLSVSVGSDDRGHLFDQNNYNSFRKRKKIEEVNNEAYFEDDEYGFKELREMYYFPDSTVSYSA